MKIKDVVDYTGRWNWSLVQMVFLKEVIRDIKATPILLIARLDDRLAWKYSAKGDFDLKSAYMLATDSMRDASFKGDWIWKLKTLPRIQVFVSKCMHHSLGVKQCLLAIRLQVEACYPRCHREVESILHILRDCPLSKAVWHQLGNWLGPLPWNHVFLFGIWLLWKYRNLCIFKNKNPNPNFGKEFVDRAS